MSPGSGTSIISADSSAVQKFIVARHSSDFHRPRLRLQHSAETFDDVGLHLFPSLPDFGSLIEGQAQVTGLPVPHIRTSSCNAV